MVRLAAVFLAAAALLGAPAAAQTQRSAPGPSARVALVVGNAAYKDAALRTPVADARAMALQLRRLGFTVLSRENARRQDMMAALDEFAARIPAGGLALFYFAGHALESNGQNHLLPVDTAFNAAGAASVPLTAVAERMQRAAPRESVLVIDASYRNPVPRSDRGLAAIDPPARSLVAFAAAPGSVAVEPVGGTSVFTTALVDALGNPGRTLGQIFDDVRARVRDVSGGGQTSWEASSLPTDVVLNAATGTDAYARRSEQPPAKAAATSAASVSAPPVPPAPSADPLLMLEPPLTVVSSNAEGIARGDRIEPGRVLTLKTGARVAIADRNGMVMTLTGPMSGTVGTAASAGVPAATPAVPTLSARPAPPPSAQQRPSPSPPPKPAGKDFVVVSSSAPSLRKDERVRADTPIAIGAGQRVVLLDADGRSLTLSGPFTGTLAEAGGDPLAALLGLGSGATPAVAPPADTQIARYPTLDAPEQVAVGQKFAVQVWLSEDLVTPQVKVTPGDAAQVGREGRLIMSLPASSDSWRLGVALAAPGFDVDGPRAQEILLRRAGDSTVAMFQLRAKEGTAQRPQKLRFTLWHDGQFIAQIAREIAVVPAGRELVATGLQPAPTAVKTQRDAVAATRAGAELPDLTVHILYDEPTRLGGGQVIVASPHFNPPSHLMLGRFETPGDAMDWLSARYGEMLITAEDINTGAGDDMRARNEAMRRRIAPLMAGFGRELYRRFAPQPFKDALRMFAQRSDVQLQSIQIFTNNPVLPWELMRPDGPGGGKSAEYLAVDHRVARWHVGDDRRLADRPPQLLTVREIAAVAPRYQGSARLPFQDVELATLRTLPGFRAVDGRMDSLRRLVSDPPDGIMHFSGHGIIERGAGATASYRIGLEDGLLDLTTWRGLAEGSPQRHPLFFFNACQLGQADAAASFVDGWAPAVLETGASGYVGALWPLFDRSAAEFSRRVYARLAGAAPVRLADALAEARKAFYETGDPTYLAYAYYGDVNLKIVSGR